MKQYRENLCSFERHKNTTINSPVSTTFGIRASDVEMLATPSNNGEETRGRRVSRSPAPLRGRREVIIHHSVADNIAARTQFPMLTHTNYQEWAMLMQVNFEAVGWWYVVEPENGDEINYRLVRLALAVILCSVPPDMLSSLWERRLSAAAAWEVIKRIRIELHRVREVNA
jgi:hypothetical protein